MFDLRPASFPNKNTSISHHRKNRKRNRRTSRVETLEVRNLLALIHQGHSVISDGVTTAFEANQSIATFTVTPSGLPDRDGEEFKVDFRIVAGDHVKRADIWFPSEFYGSGSLSKLILSSEVRMQTRLPVLLDTSPRCGESRPGPFR